MVLDSPTNRNMCGYSKPSVATRKGMQLATVATDIHFLAPTLTMDWERQHICVGLVYTCCSQNRWKWYNTYRPILKWGCTVSDQLGKAMRSQVDGNLKIGLYVQVRSQERGGAALGGGGHAPPESHVGHPDNGALQFNPSKAFQKQLHVTLSTQKNCESYHVCERFSLSFPPPVRAGCVWHYTN